MEGRLGHAIEGLVFGVIFAGLYWVLGAIIKSITRKEIRTGSGYAIAVVLGYIFRRFLLITLTG
jgi:hypothetical protein